MHNSAASSAPLAKGLRISQLQVVYNAPAESSDPISFARIQQTLRREVNETFTQGVTAVGRSGRYIRVCCYSESAHSRRPHTGVRADETELPVVTHAALLGNAI